MKKLSFEQAYGEKYLGTIKILDWYEEATGVRPDWDNFTKANLNAFVECMLTHVAQSSAKTYAAQFKAIMNLYRDQHSFPMGWEKVLSVKNDASEQVYLTEDEIGRIIDYVPETKTEAIVQQQFILGAMTGARHSDYQGFTKNNIRDCYIVYVSKKTHIKASVPLAPIVADILQVEDGHVVLGESKNKVEVLENENVVEDSGFENHSRSFGNGKFGGAFRLKVSDPTFNNTLRSICKKVGITQVMSLYKRGEFIEVEKWEAVSSHCCRRSFASNLYLRGCDIYTISRMLGHASVEQTAQRYICCPIRKLSDEVLQFFINY